MVGVFAGWLGACGIYGTALQVKPAGNVNGHELSIGYLEHPNTEKGYLAWVHREGETWRLDKVEAAWSTAADSPVPSGSERLYVLPREKDRFLVSPIFTESKLYDGPSVTRVEVFECGLNWPHTPGNTPCESALTKKHWSPEGLAGGQRDIDREAIEAAVRQTGVLDAIVARQAHDQIEGARLAKVDAFASHVHARVTHVHDKIGALDIAPARASEKMNLTRRIDEVTEGQPVKFAAWFRDVDQVSVTGDVRCTLKAKEETYAVPFHAHPEPRTLDIEAVVTGCRISNPRPASFVASDRTLTARLETFVPGGDSGINLANDSTEYVSVTTISGYYLKDVQVVAKLTIELAPHANRTFYLPLFKNASINLDEANAAGRRYHFGLAVLYKKGSAPETTLLREDDVPVR